MQINIYGTLASTRPAAEKLTDGKYNMTYAHDMWLSQGLNPWSAYKTGAYLKYLGG